MKHLHSFLLMLLKVKCLYIRLPGESLAGFADRSFLFEVIVLNCCFNGKVSIVALLSKFGPGIFLSLVSFVLRKAYIFTLSIHILTRSWCPDRTMAQARKYIAESMGANYAENVILDLEKTWEESDCNTPLINFLSMGSDPTSLIENLAKRHKFGMFHYINSEDSELFLNRKNMERCKKASDLQFGYNRSHVLSCVGICFTTECSN